MRSPSLVLLGCRATVRGRSLTFCLARPGPGPALLGPRLRPRSLGLPSVCVRTFVKREDEGEEERTEER